MIAGPVGGGGREGRRLAVKWEKSDWRVGWAVTASRDAKAIGKCQIFDAGWRTTRRTRVAVVPA